MNNYSENKYDKHIKRISALIEQYTKEHGKRPAMLLMRPIDYSMLDYACHQGGFTAETMDSIKSFQGVTVFPCDDVLDYEFLTDIDILDIQNYLDKLKQRKIPIEFFKLADEQVIAYHGILNTELPNVPIFEKIMQKDIERALLNNR